MFIFNRAKQPSGINTRPYRQHFTDPIILIMDKITIACIILISLGILPLLVCLIKMRMLKAFKQKAVSTTATITHIETHRGFKGNAYYVLILEYQTVDMSRLLTGRAITSKKYVAGSVIPLMYLPGDPVKFSIDSGKGYPYMIAICIVFSVFIVWCCFWLNGLKYTTH